MPLLVEPELFLQVTVQEVVMPEPVLPEEIGSGFPRLASLSKRELHFQRLLDKLPAGAYMCDTAGLITYFNAHAVSLWGRAPKLNDPVDRFCGSFKLFSIEGSPINHDQCWMAKALQMNQEFNGREIVVERPNGERLTVLAYANPVRDEVEKLIGAVNVLVDITDRTRAEQELRCRQQEIEQLNRRLKSAMLETHHRVKNNLQIIAAMIDMRLMENPASIAPDELRRIGNHTHTLAAMHDLLTQEAKASGEAHFLSAREVLQKLVFFLQQGAGAQRFTTRFEDARLNARQSSSLALIVSELISNAVKHGSGEVEVTFRVVDSRGILEVCDNGPGFSPDFDVHHAANTGLDLVENLSRWDLACEVTYGNRAGGGAVVTMAFPVVNGDTAAV